MDIQSLVQGFARHIKALKAPEYKESQLRLQYLDPFWNLLGWDTANSAQCSPQEVEVLIEPSMDSPEDDGMRSREPDYLFRLNGFPRFIVEAKKPAVDLDADRKAIFQAKRYAWSATIPFAILTNFEQFRLFDTTLKPILNEPTRGLVREFAIDFQDYPAKWEEFLAAFGRDAVAGSSLERLRAKIKKVAPTRRLRTVDRMLSELRGEEPVDRVFLDYLETHRQHFARAIYHDNKAEFPEADTLHGAAKLTAAVQRLIDRLIFMRVCEDRGVTKWGSIREMLDRISGEGGDFYKSLCEEFRDLDREYNGYLYKYHFSESLSVPGDVLADFVRTLYPPDGPWDFRAIGDDILGIVYEKFLGRVVAVKQGHAVVEEKPEVRHAGGVYYTPRFVVDIIIRRVIGVQIAGKTPAQVLDVKVLDPACGSGSFLVAAFQFLIDHCLAAIAADPSLASIPATPRARKKRKDIAFKDKQGRWHLAPDFKAALLTNCIHGVDIDQQAVEVTIMSLYLKLLEGLLPSNWQKEWVENQLLPPLENNIHCGNSLIDHGEFDEYLYDTRGLFPDDDDIRFRINRFDWTSRTRGLGRYLDSQVEGDRGRKGFDCIIGNPPYIRVQELNKWAPDECEFYKWNYGSAAKGNYDVYVVFTEKALSLLAPNGLLGFIMPHKFWQAKYGEGLRKIIADGKHLKAVVDFGHQQVFKGATTYTAVHILGREPGKSKVPYAYFDDLQDGAAQCNALDSHGKATGITAYKVDMPTDESPWRFIGPKQARPLLKAAENASHTLGEIADRLYQGVRTSKNEVFVLSRIPGEEDRYYSKQLERVVEMEPAILRPFLGGDHIRRYELLPAEAFVVFPYEVLSGDRGVRLLPWSRIKKIAPKTAAYLRACEDVLRAREDGAMDHEHWHAYGRTQNLDRFGKPRILVPDMMDNASFAMDTVAEAAFVSGYGIALKANFADHLPLLTGLLNSKLLAAYLKSVSTPLRGGWFRTFPQFLRFVPIKLPTTVEDKKLAARIVVGVRAIMVDKVKLRDANRSDRDRTSLEREVEYYERRIDEDVFRLYGVEGLPDSGS